MYRLIVRYSKLRSFCTCLYMLLRYLIKLLCRLFSFSFLKMCFSVWNFQRHMKSDMLSSQLYHVQRLPFILGLNKPNLFSSSHLIRKVCFFGEKKKKQPTKLLPQLKTVMSILYVRFHSSVVSWRHSDLLLMVPLISKL